MLDPAGAAGEDESAGGEHRIRDPSPANDAARPDPTACTSGSTVHPTPSRAISRKHLGLVRLGHDLDRGTERPQLAFDGRAGVRAEREEHPGTPTRRRRRPRTSLRGARPREAPRAGATSSTVASDPGGSTTTARSSAPARSWSSSSLDGATTSRSSTSGLSRRYARRTAGKWATAAASIMPTRQPARPTGTGVGRPPGQITGVGHDPAGVGQDLRGLRPQHLTSADPLEQVDADTAFELGQTLRERRGRDPERRRRLGEGRRGGGRHQVRELRDCERGQRRFVGGHRRTLPISDSERSSGIVQQMPEAMPQVI